MMEEKNLHGIFTVNPLDLKALVAQFVKVTLVNKEILHGILYTIDPVSQSVVLIQKETSGDMTLKIILKHSVDSIEPLPEIPQDQQNIALEDIFKPNKCDTLSQHSKEDVKNWLLKNMIPVVENGDKLVIDSLEIHPPYGVDECYSDNSIVLSRIKHLLTQMPCGS